MKLVPLIVLTALVLPFAFAGPARDDATVTLTLTAINGGTLYISACRGLGVDTNVQPDVEIVDDCLTSGVYQESNNVQGLQVRAGLDSNGNAFAADTPVVALP